MKVGGTARTLDLNVSGTTPASAVAGKEKTLYEKWIEFLKRIKNSVGDLPSIVLMKTVNFYRENVDTDVDVGFTALEHRVFAYKLNDKFGWISFFIIGGTWIRFEWIKHSNTIAVYFDHLARPEESAY